MVSPCKDCGDREIRCHCTCERYKEWKAWHDKAVADERAERSKSYSDKSGQWFRTDGGYWRNKKIHTRRK